MSSCEPALVPGIMLSDMVIREHGTGKVTAIGVFHGFLGQGFPLRVPRFFCTVAISNLTAGSDSLTVNARIEMARTSHVIASSTAELKWQNGQLQQNMVLDIPLPFQSVTFPEPGLYKVQILIDGAEAANRHVQVTQLTADPNQTRLIE